MLTRVLSYGFISALVVSSLTSSNYSLEVQAEIDEIAATIQMQTPDNLHLSNLAPESVAHDTVTFNNEEIIVPLESDQEIKFNAPDEFILDFQLGISLENERLSDGVLADDGSVVYSGENFSQSVVATASGVRINSVLENASSPERIEHAISLPAGTRLVTVEELRRIRNEFIPASEDGKVFVIDENSEVLVSVSAPWAFDASGTPVKTYYLVEENKLVQIVQHIQGTYNYPIVADPFFGYDMIAWAFWKSRPEGWTLQVTPTAWARKHYLTPGSSKAGWDELLAKYHNKGLTKNLTGMYNQYACHQRFASTKEYWNLDEWRPAVTFAATVAAKCNP